MSKCYFIRRSSSRIQYNLPVQPIAECPGIDRDTFAREIEPAYRPVVLRGLVAPWPVTRAGRESPRALHDYLHRFDNGHPVDVLIAPAHLRGRIFYDESMAGFNFVRERLPVSAVSEKLARYAKFDNRPMMAVQSALLADCLPGFGVENPLEILDPAVQPRLWLGNQVTTPAHFDESSNVACVVAGRRRFTLFPPEQVANLYVGPLDHAPTGTPISMVSFREPDFARFPRFREALEAAQCAELEAGDAIYIPPLWWHHVESTAKCNALVNYWWKGWLGAGARADSALDCLLHCILNLRHLPPEHRRAWGIIFDHYVFDPQSDAGAHIPEARRGILGEITPERARQIRAFLARKLE
jgi:hypothetical protein